MLPEKKRDHLAEKHDRKRLLGLRKPHPRRRYAEKWRTRAANSADMSDQINAMMRADRQRSASRLRCRSRKSLLLERWDERFEGGRLKSKK